MEGAASGIVAAPPSADRAPSLGDLPARLWLGDGVAACQRKGGEGGEGGASDE